MKKIFALGLIVSFLATFTACGCWDDDCDYRDDEFNHNYDWDWDFDHCPGCGSCTSDNCFDDGMKDDTAPDYARACTRDATCYADEICVNGFCTTQDKIDNGEIVEAECKVNSDCSDDSICTDGRCIPCQTDACDTSKEVECVFSSQCESGLCVDGACMAAGACAIDANCSEGHICVDNACIARPECLADAECGEGRICNASNKCEDDVECRIDSDCGEGLICVANMCAQCRLSCECPNTGDICMNGLCVADDREIKD